MANRITAAAAARSLADTPASSLADGSAPGLSRLPVSSQRQSYEA
jgi:hypothetical protein